MNLNAKTGQQSNGIAIVAGASTDIGEEAREAAPPGRH